MSNIKKNKGTNLGMLSMMITSVLIATTIPVFGYNQNQPATYTVNYIVPSDTTFNIVVSLAQTSMNFNATNGNSKLVGPIGQNISTNTAWANITNGGNVNLNFSTNLTVTIPTVTQFMASNSAMSDQVTMSNAPLSPNGWLNVPPSSTVQMYSLANFTNANTSSTSLNIFSHT